MQWSRLACLVAILLAGCAPALSTRTQDPQEDPDEEEYAVWSAVISRQYAAPGRTIPILYIFTVTTPVKLVVVKGVTVPAARDRHGVSETRKLRTKRSLTWLSREAIDDFIAKNRRAYPIRDRFSLDLKRLVLTRDESREIFGEDAFAGWEEFYRRYPQSNGIIRLSRVGLDDSRTQAIVFVAHWRGSLDGAGYYLILVKQEGAWVVQSAVGIWIS